MYLTPFTTFKSQFFYEAYYPMPKPSIFAQI